MRNVGALILAAGGSSRFGRPKQLISFRGATLVRRAVQAAVEAHCAPVVVVVGESASAIRDELRETPAVIVENVEWPSGLGTSIRCGLRSCAASIESVVLIACDQPLADATIVTGLITEQERSGKPIVASRYANTLGIPALFARSCFEELLALPDEAGAKMLIAARSNDVVSIAFEAGAIDIDTPADFQRLIAESE